jgi:hypothetical protein
MGESSNLKKFDAGKVFGKLLQNFVHMLALGRPAGGKVNNNRTTKMRWGTERTHEVAARRTSNSFSVKMFWTRFDAISMESKRPLNIVLKIGKREFLKATAASEQVVSALGA